MAPLLHSETGPGVSLQNDPAQLAIPESLGKIQTRVSSGSPRWVIHIQDIHAHLGAQENIAAILDHLNIVYGIKTVALEGGWSETTFPESWGLPNSREKQMLARGLLEEGYLNGSGYAALFSSLPLKLHGLEDPALYQKNREMYLRHLAIREKVLGLVEEWRKRLTAQKTAVYNNAFLGFDAALNDFREGRKAETFLPDLLRTAAGHEISLTDLDQVSLFKQALEAEKSIDKEKLQAEAARLTDAHKNDRLHFEELLRSGKVPEEKLRYYPEALKFRDLVKLRDMISYRVFFAQIEEAISRIKEKLFLTQAERGLDASWTRFLVAKRLLLFQAVPEDLKAFASWQEALRSESADAGLGPALEISLGFYALAQKRDAVFFEKIMTDPALSESIAVVTGGFHTDGLSARLEEAGISYIVITPDLGSEPAITEALYFKRLKDSIAASATLSEMQNRFLIPAFDRAFVAGIQILKETRSIVKAVESVALALQGKAATSPAGPGVPRKSLDITGFTSWPVQKKKAALRDWFKTAREGRVPLVLAAKTSTLQEILKTDMGLSLWNAFVAPERTYTVGEVQDREEYLDALIGIKAKILRIKPEPDETFAAVLEKRFKDPIEKNTLAVIDGDYTSARTLVLPVHPVSIFLARLMLEESVSGTLDAGILDAMGEILEEMLQAQGLLEKAA